MRDCLNCGKPFVPPVRKRGGEGPQIYCGRKCCGTAWARTHKESQREKRLAKGAPARLPVRDALFVAAKCRAKEQGIEFSITQEDVIVPDTCPLLNIPLVRGKKVVSPGSPSLDRIDSSKGYIPGNVWVISFKANTAKNNLTLAELKALVENLEERLLESKLHETRKG